MNCSLQTLRNRLATHGIRWRVRRKKVYVTQHDAVKRKRFAQRMRRRPNSFLKRLVFFDGTPFILPRSFRQAKDRHRKSQGRKVPRKINEGLENDCSGYSGYEQGGRIQLWGCLGVNQRRGGRAHLCGSVMPPVDLRKRRTASGKIKKNDNSVSMNHQRFKVWVRKHLLRWCTKTLGFKMRRGAKTPTSKKPILIFDHERAIRMPASIKYLKSLGFLICPGYPSGSPDMNPIENAWSLLKQKVEPKQAPDGSDRKRNVYVKKNPSRHPRGELKPSSGAPILDCSQKI